MITKASRQIRWTLPLGNEPVGTKRLALWREAALKTMHDNPKLFNSWIRLVLDNAARAILDTDK